MDYGACLLVGRFYGLAHETLSGSSAARSVAAIKLAGGEDRRAANDAGAVVEAREDQVALGGDSLRLRGGRGRRAGAPRDRRDRYRVRLDGRPRVAVPVQG